MFLRDKIETLKMYVQNMQADCAAIENALDEAKYSWPDHQIIPGAVWFDREKTPPRGVIWASNGMQVWVIHSDGLPIPASATAVKFWTNALIPAPPLFT